VSTISREVHRNGGSDRYRAARSISYLGSGAASQALQAGLPSVAEADSVSIKLQRQWSPEQIAGWLKRTYPGELQNQVSHETI
jgi:IS30 family transposase